MKYNSPILLFLFLFRRARFIEKSEEYSKWLESPKAKAEKERVRLQSQSAQSAREIGRALAVSFVLVFVSVVLGFFVGRIITGFQLRGAHLVSEVTQYLGIAVLLWATLGRVGWNIQTSVGTTLPERVNDMLFRLLYVIGSFMLALSTSISFGGDS